VNAADVHVENELTHERLMLYAYRIDMLLDDLLAVRG
jgi:hypothetical protein